MSGNGNWDGDLGSLTLRSYLLDHTILAMEGPSKPSHSDIVGGDLEEGEAAFPFLPTFSPYLHLCTHPPSSRPLPKSPSMALSTPPPNPPFHSPTSYSCN